MSTKTQGTQIKSAVDRRREAGFQPGKSGNPGGRPKALKHIEAAAREHTEAAIQVLADTLHDVAAPHPARVRAAEILLDRGWGKPSQTVNVRKIKSIGDLDEEELMALAGLTSGAEAALH